MTTGTLDQYAAGVDQTNRDLQRQTKSYDYLRRMIDATKAVSQSPPPDQLTPQQVEELPRLPILMIRQPALDEGQQMPDVIEFDLNTAPRQLQGAALVILQSMAGDVGNKLLQDWDALNNINGQAQEILTRLRQPQQPAENGQHQQPQQPQQPQQQPPAQTPPAPQQPATGQPQMGLPPRQ